MRGTGLALALAGSHGLRVDRQGAPAQDASSESSEPPQVACKCEPDADGVLCGGVTGDDCVLPTFKPCPPVPVFAKDYDVSGTGFSHGTRYEVTCKEGYVAASDDYPTSTWGTDDYAGGNTTKLSCNDGAWLGIAPPPEGAVPGVPLPAIPAKLFCISKKHLVVLRQMVEDREWTTEKLAEADKIPFKWVDTGANARKGALLDAQSEALDYVAKTKRGHPPPVEAFERLSDIFHGAAVEAIGTPFDDTACKDLEQHTLYRWKKSPTDIAPRGLPVTVSEPNDKNEMEQAIPLTCRYTEQSSSTGWDFVHQEPIMFYRNGCYCEIRTVGGCPFEEYPLYMHFGFSGVDEKIISRSMGSHQPNALCWYWSDPTYPEHGYIGYDTDIGKGLVAPQKSSSDLSDAMHR